MIEKLKEDLYSLSLPLPIPSLKSINVYVIKKERESLLIDTGMNTKESFGHLLEAFNSIGVEPNRLNIFITHFHIDHFGNVIRLIKWGKGVKIFIHEEDWKNICLLKKGLLKKEVFEFIRKSGFPYEDTSSLFPKYVEEAYEIERKDFIKFVRDKEILEFGDGDFLCLHTPGHTKGHMTLLQLSSGLFFSGDHILKEITPTIQARLRPENPLKDYLSSLKKINELSIECVLPAHGSPFKGVKERIEELLIHHERRSKEILSILEGEKSIYEIASLMKWDIGEGNFASLPFEQRLFATGETMAHLRYLEEKGLVKGRVVGVYKWKRVS